MSGTGTGSAKTSPVVECAYCIWKVAGDDWIDPTTWYWDLIVPCNSSECTCDEPIYPMAYLGQEQPGTCYPI